jgi:hypothetical protein
MDTAGRFHADADPGGEEEFSDGVEHDERDRQRGGGADLAGGGLDEVSARLHGNHARGANVVVSDQLACFEDDLEMDVAAKLFHRRNLIMDLGVFTTQERGAVDDHVDFIGAGTESDARVFEFGFQRGLPARKIGGHRGNLDRRAAQEGFGRRDEVRIHADRRDRPHPIALGCRMHRLVAEGHHLARRVPSFQRGQVEHGKGEAQALHFRVRLDTPLGESSGAFFDHDLVDPSERRRLPGHGEQGAHESRKISRSTWNHKKSIPRHE